MARLLCLLASVVLLCVAAQGHILITSPTVGVRQLGDSNTNPCNYSSPASPRYMLPQSSTVVSITVYSSDTHGGGNATLYLGYGSPTPSVYPYVGPSVWLTPTSSSATLNWTIPYIASETIYATIELFFSSGGNYQCLDLQWSAASNPPSPPSPTPPPPYIPWPTGVIGRSLSSGQSASYWLFNSAGNYKQLCGWEYAAPWRSWGNWFNSYLGTYDSANLYSLGSYAQLVINHTDIGTYNFGICPHEEVSSSYYFSLWYISSSKSLRVVQNATDQVQFIYACSPSSSCSYPTYIVSVNTTSATWRTSYIPHVYADSGTYDLEGNVLVVADSSHVNVWFYDTRSLSLFGLSNFTGLVDYFIAARISVSKNKTYVLGSRNKTAVLYSIDMSNGYRTSISLTSNPIAQYTSGTTFSYVLDDANGVLFGTYVTSGNPLPPYGVFSIPLSTGYIQYAPFENIDPAGLVIHS